MASELQVTNLADTIRDRVRSTIMDSIPSEQIDGLVMKEWESFFEIRKPKNNYDPTPTTSAFQDMVRAEVKAFMEVKVKESVQKEMERINSIQWEQQGKKALEGIIQAYAPSVLAGLTDMIVMNAVSKLQSSGAVRF